MFGNLKCYNNDSINIKVYDLIPGVISASQTICYEGKPQDLTGTIPEVEIVCTDMFGNTTTLRLVLGIH